MNLLPLPRRLSHRIRAWRYWLALPEVIQLAVILSALMFIGSLIG